MIRVDVKTGDQETRRSKMDHSQSSQTRRPERKIRLANRFMKGSQRDKSETQEGHHQKTKPSDKKEEREREAKEKRQTQQHDHGRVQQDTDRDIPKWSQNQAATDIARTQE